MVTFLLYPHKEERERDREITSVCLFIRALIPFIRASPSRLDNLPKAHLQIPSLRIRLSTSESGQGGPRHKYSAYSRGWGQYMYFPLVSTKVWDSDLTFVFQNNIPYSNSCPNLRPGSKYYIGKISFFLKFLNPTSQHILHHWLLRKHSMIH